ncbi:hypothetical protein CD191_23740 [Paenibacillus odorifer]|uniref:Uncharacterized protein n=1 Tax=Paenibacillus odorifer TaxID=189426 RepID=A0AAD0KLK4_9BACL|nr:hypothetical protein CD191_23740 [Paenibacillus odorifer]
MDWVVGVWDDGDDKNAYVLWAKEGVSWAECYAVSGECDDILRMPEKNDLLDVVTVVAMEFLWQRVVTGRWAMGSMCSAFARCAEWI